MLKAQPYKPRALISFLCLLTFGVFSWGCTGITGRKAGNYIFQIDPSTFFLTEEIALEVAREALEKDGFSPREWHLSKSDVGKQIGPGGQRDQYFDRWSNNPPAGRVHFANGKKRRSYAVYLHEKNLICTVFRGL